MIGYYQIRQTIAIYIAYLCLALAFHSRAMLGHLVKILFFLLFVAFLFSVQAGHAIAVVRTDSAFVFVRPAPFAPEIIPMDRVPEVQVYNTGVVRALTLLRFKGYGMDYVECRGVWVSDRRACEVLDQLVRSLNKARSAHMPMPLHFNSP